MLPDVDPSPNATWVLLGTISALSIFWLWTKTRRPYLKYNIPPFPVAPQPIFGHMFMVRKNMIEKLEQWREKVGDIFSLDIGGRHDIVICGYDVFKEVLVKNADKLPNVPRIPANHATGETNKGIFGAGGDNWKEQRTVSLSILRAFGMGKNVLAKKIQEEVNVYIEKLAELNGQAADVRILTNVSVSNVICAIAVGKRFEHDDPYFTRLMNVLNKIVQLPTKTIPVTIFPILRYLPGDLFSIKELSSSIKEVNTVFSEFYIEEIKNSFNEEEDPENFVAAYLKELRKKERNGEPTLLDESNLKAVIRNLFVAGTETTSTTILWCFLYMLHHPDVQEKVFHEIESQIGTERAPCVQDKPKLTYLNAVLMETQRMASLVPIGILRFVDTPFEVRGFTFPKGSVIQPNIHSVLHDKKVWGDPENFRPERFLNKDGTLSHPDEVIPFSIGRRVCLGEALARMELFLFLSLVFQRFSLEPVDKSAELPSLDGIVGVTRMPRPFKMRFVERQA